MAFCSHCGKPVTSSTRFCPGCGTFIGLSEGMAVLPAAVVIPAMPLADYAMRDRHVIGHRDDLPMPPTLHWLLVALFGCLSFGLFWVIWPMVQAAWVKKLDEHSHASVLLAVAAACYVTGWLTVPLPVLSLFAFIAQWMLVVIAFSQMAHITQRVCRNRGGELNVNPVTLFVFGQLYFQGILRWVSKWKGTGRTYPTPPEAVFWALLVFAVVGGVVLVVLGVISAFVALANLS